MASGKSTVAQALAARFERSVHLKGDAFRRFIVNGQAPLSFELSEEGERQLLLRYEIAAEAAKRYFEAGFTVVYQDIILGPTLETVVSRFEGLPLTVVVLAPDSETIAHREANRGKSGYKNTAEIARFDKVLREETPKLGTWIDSSSLTVRETVDKVVLAAELGASS
jgi:chloramphenicol 3-O-phosphotransferase